jgi:hypothetical protein
MSCVAVLLGILLNIEVRRLCRGFAFLLARPTLSIVLLFCRTSARAGG